MKIEIIGRNYNVGERLREITEQKLGKLDKYFENEAIVKASFKKYSSSCSLEVMLDYLGKLVRATATGENFYDNLDVVLPKLEGQIRKYRTRFDKEKKNSAYKEVAVFDKVSDTELKKGAVVKQKKFEIKALTLQEAIEEIELLGHNFYIFKDAKTNNLQILYLRNDGDYGLIEPTV